MAFDSKKLYTTPRGLAVFPKLIKPDTKFKKEGEYVTKLKFPNKADEAKFIADMTIMFDQAYAHTCAEQKSKLLKKASYPWRPEVEIEKDSEGNVIKETPTGCMLFTFKLKAEIKLKDNTVVHPKPGFFDSRGKAIKNTADLSIGGGSTIKISYTIRPFFMAKEKEAGMSFQMRFVQLIELVEFGGVSAEKAGFGVEEGGYDHEDAGSEAGSEPSAPSNEAPDPKDSDF